MIEIELDGKKIQVTEGSMVMHAADQAGTYIPHFCYHKKLSIAANCRMCLVDIEKAPKPMPACATPVTQGMIVRTKTDKAVKAQKSVMEFLLINHPLDCPICDQGGECQLQDLAVGYGKSASRYDEEKRVILHKNVGPLISMEEMSRCIQCTRCVRFGQEVSGVMELGMVNRGEHSEITTFLGQTVDSELSGNMIDICPVGALTSKPFRYSARTWELSRRKSVSPHDSTGANLIVQVKNQQVMRVVPLENEAVNECWIADRDRFSYEAVNSQDPATGRLTQPMIKQGGQWREVDWQTALDYVGHGLRDVKAEHGAASLGALASPHATVEELFLLSRLMRELGSDNIDHRLRHSDFSNTAPSLGANPAARWLGLPIADLTSLDRALVIGSFLRKDHPLFAQRLRQAAKANAQIHALSATGDDWLISLSERVIAAPSRWAQVLADIAVAVATSKGVAAPAPGAANAQAEKMAASLLSGQRKAILLGNAAAQHPQAGTLLALADWLAKETGATVGYFGEAANSVGAQLVGAQPSQEGLNAGQMLGLAVSEKKIKAFLLLQVEPNLDTAYPMAAHEALSSAAMVVAMTAFKSPSLAAQADVLLPVAPFSETSGTFVNAEGRAQSFYGVVKPRGETRPAWKVLRVLGNVLQLSGFDFDTSEQVRDAALGDLTTLPSRLSNASALAGITIAPPVDGLERIADVPIYATDALVRRSPALQATADAQAPALRVPAKMWAQMGWPADVGPHGTKVRVALGGVSAELLAAPDAQLPDNVLWMSAGLESTAGLGPMFGRLSLDKS